MEYAYINAVPLYLKHHNKNTLKYLQLITPSTSITPIMYRILSSVSPINQLLVVKK